VQIDPSTTVIVTFSRPVDRDTLAASTFFLAELADDDTLGAAVPSAIQVTEDDLSAVLTPDAPLAGDTRYEIHLTTDVADLEGIHLSTEVTATFRTL
jgi:hypothetical protein